MRRQNTTATGQEASLGLWEPGLSEVCRGTGCGTRLAVQLSMRQWMRQWSTHRLNL